MADHLFVGVLEGPEGGPFLVTHNLDTYSVSVSLSGITVGADPSYMVEVPFPWRTESRDAIWVDPVLETVDGPARLAAAGYTVVVRATA